MFFFAVLWFRWSVKRHCVAKISQGIWERFLYENNRNYNFYKFIYKFIKFVLSFVCLFVETKTRITFLASWWSGNQKYFCFLFITNRALLQRYTEFNRHLYRDFLTCYSCSIWKWFLDTLLRIFCYAFFVRLFIMF